MQRLNRMSTDARIAITVPCNESQDRSRDRITAVVCPVRPQKRLSEGSGLSHSVVASG